MIKFQRPPISASILTIAGISILCGLGTWQLKRLEWKESLLEKIEERQHSFIETLKVSDLSVENEFINGQIKARPLYNKEIAIVPRTYDEQVGMHVIPPFELEDGTTLLVNRGWAPKDYKLGRAPEWTKSDFGHIPHIAGTIRSYPKANSFTPKNDPAEGKWYHIEPNEIAAALNLSAPAPVMLYEIDLLDGAHGKHYPTPLALEPKINNNHLQYAYFWFAMALALLSIYCLRFCISKKN